MASPNIFGRSSDERNRMTLMQHHIENPDDLDTVVQELEHLDEAIHWLAMDSDDAEYQSAIDLGDYLTKAIEALNDAGIVWRTIRASNK